jgi:hypothetical protein
VNQNGGYVYWGSESISGADQPLYLFTGVPNYNYISGVFAVGTEYVGYNGTAS